MLKTPIARGIALATLGASLAVPTMAQADFIEDSKVNLELRNFYFNRDFRHTDSDGKNKAEEWAQGFILRAESGYTEGFVGFGLDAMGLLGVKLDSSPADSGTGLLPVGDSGRAADDYSELAVAAKAKISNTVLKVGNMQVKNPALATSDSRLLPMLIEGGHLVSKEIDGLTLEGGYFTEINQKESTNYEDMAYGSGDATVYSDEFAFAGGSYQVIDNLTAGYYYSNLEDVYKQHSVNLVHVLPLGDKQSFKTDLRYARSTDDGSIDVDNKAFGAMFTYALGGHKFGLAYQKMSGDTGYIFVNGTDPYLVNFVQIGNYSKADEKSWQARYDYNFAAMGIPGLSFMTRYITGDNYGANHDGKEWERDMDIGYVFQEGPAKNLGLKWRNATFRSNGTGADYNENRLIVSYTLPLM